MQHMDFDAGHRPGANRILSQLKFGAAAGLAALLVLPGGALAPAGAFAQAQPNGSQIFTSAGCAGCHGETGNGGMGPRLSGNTDLANDQHVLQQILNGGVQMPPFGSKLSDAEVAAVATYIRTGLGNSFGPITPQQVAQARQAPQSSAATTTAPAANPASTNAAGANAPAAGQPAAAQVDPMAVGAPATGVKQPTTNMPDQKTLDAADTATDSWLMYNKGYTGQRYSSLNQITASNAATLQPICSLQLGEQSAFQGSPVVYDGLIYTTTKNSTVAIDAKTCHQVWRNTYAPKGPEPLDTNRGIAIAEGRIFRGTTDGHFFALDAKTGDLLWNIRPVDSAQGYFMSSAPIVWNGMVLTGTAGADWGATGKMFAFDVKDGHKIWEFDEIVPATFGTAEAASTGGGSNWTSYSLDTSTGMIYVPVGNPAPDFAAKYRPGTNLYTNSTIVLDAKTGKLDHYYQQIPNDPLDRDSSASPVLIKLTDSGGKQTLYTVVANKAGHMYLYDEAAKKEVYKVETTTLKNFDAPPTTQGTHVCPGINGGVEWYGPAFDPKESALYVGSVDWCTTFTLGEVRYAPGQLFFGGTYSFDPVSQAAGWIRAYNAADGKDKWQYKSALPVVAGVTPTAGGVLLSGELTGDFIVLDKATGKVLYRFYTGGPIAGGISTYEIGGRQYVVVPSGNQSRTWSPNTQPSTTMFIFALPQKGAANG
jgi:alcohol dehydrogenase (cytochrome c)